MSTAPGMAEMHGAVAAAATLGRRFEATGVMHERLFSIAMRSTWCPSPASRSSVAGRPAAWRPAAAGRCPGASRVACTCGTHAVALVTPVALPPCPTHTAAAVAAPPPAARRRCHVLVLAASSRQQEIVVVGAGAAGLAAAYFAAVSGAQVRRTGCGSESQPVCRM